MRNLSEWPVTDEEVIENLKAVIEKIKKQNEGMIPDMETYLLCEALRRLDTK